MNAPADLTRCERCDSPLERGDLRCAVCGHAAPDTGARLDARRLVVLRCDGCGAAASYDAAVGAPRCAFCESVMHVEELVDPVEQTGGWLPFSVSRAEARAALKRWLKNQGFFRPADLATASRLEEVRALHWVAWVCDARAHVTWAADSDAGAGRSAWAPHAGEAHLAFDDLVVSASRGLSDEEVRGLARHYDLTREVEAPPDPMGGDAPHQEAFDVQRSGARSRILGAIHRAAAAIVEREHVPGRSVRNVGTSALLESLETRRLALPAWVLVYRYRDATYRAVVCGQDARGIVGSVPFSWARLVLVVGGVLVLIALAVLLALLLS